MYVCIRMHLQVYHAYFCVSEVDFMMHNFYITESNKCFPNPCPNGTTCMEYFNNYICACPSCYNELNCEDKEGKCSDSFMIVLYE